VNRIMSNGSPGLLVNLTNDAWFGDTLQPWIHLALAKLRAIEQRRFFVRSTNSGVSAFVDPVGRIMASTPTFSEIALAEDLRWLSGSTLFHVLGDMPWWLVTMGAFVMAFRQRPQRPPSPPRPSLPMPRASMPPVATPSRPPAAPGAPSAVPTAAQPSPVAAPPATVSTGAQAAPAPLQPPTVNPDGCGALPRPGDKPPSCAPSRVVVGGGAACPATGRSRLRV